MEHFRHELDGVPFEHAAPAPHRGILLKAGDGQKAVFGIGSGFKKRFCVVDAQGILKYYDKDPAGLGVVEPKGEIDLAGAKATAVPEQSQSFCFKVAGPKCEREYVLAATDAKDMSKWMRLIDAFGVTVTPESRQAAAPPPPPPPDSEEAPPEVPPGDGAMS